VPAIYYNRFFSEPGGLISYGDARGEQFRLAAGYIDRILKGEKPADLPVQVPTKFELIINLKPAKALGARRARIASAGRRRCDRIVVLFAAMHESDSGPSRRFQRFTITVAIGGQRTWLDLLLVWPGRE
jgi:hypothetical protein